MESARFFLSVLVLIGTSMARGDPDALQDFCVADTSSSTIFMNGFPCLNPSKVTAKHFMTSDLARPGNTSANALGLSVTFTLPQNMPGINTLGLTMARADLAVGGTVPPHSHPRATEIIFVQQGEVIAGFVDTSNKLYSAEVKAGDVFVFPKGMLHFLQNRGSTPVFIIVAYNSQNPGVSLVRQATFASNPGIPFEVLTKSFNISPEEVEKIRNSFGGGN